MRLAIEFDREFLFVAVEIQNVVAKLVLAAELEFTTLPVTEQFPEQFFGRRLFLPQFTRSFLQPGEIKSTAKVPTPFSHMLRALSPSPLTHWERGWG